MKKTFLPLHMTERPHTGSTCKQSNKCFACGNDELVTWARYVGATRITFARGKDELHHLSSNEHSSSSPHYEKTTPRARVLSWARFTCAGPVLSSFRLLNDKNVGFRVTRQFVGAVRTMPPHTMLLVANEIVLRSPASNAASQSTASVRERCRRRSNVDPT